MENNRYKTIMIVEDEVPIAMKLQDEVRSFGYQVPEFATHGGEALQLAADERLDLALVDIGLPDMDGVDLACKLRSRYGVRTVFITSYDDSATVQRAKESIPLDYLTKPATGARLRESIEWALLDLDSIEDEARQLVPEYDRWVVTPHDRLGGKCPKEVIGTPLEVDLRRLLRAVVQGMPT